MRLEMKRKMRISVMSERLRNIQAFAGPSSNEKLIEKRPAETGLPSFRT
jgi:hypothetical protein